MRRTRSGKRIEITPRDVAIFRLLKRYRYLRSTFIHAFAGGASENRFKERMSALFHEGYLDRPEQQWQVAECRHTPAVYELGRGARRVLDSLGGEDVAPATALGTSAYRQFQHALLICDIVASIELELQADPSKRLVTWREIVAKAPQLQGRERGLCWKTNVYDSKSGRTAELTVVPDAMFGIAYKRDGRDLYRFLALEADRATMPVTRCTFEQSSFLRKLLAYSAVIDRRMHTASFGLPNLIVLTVTTSQHHLAQMLEVLAQRGGETGPFLFKSTVEFPEYIENRRPMTEILAMPWRRVGTAVSISD